MQIFGNKFKSASKRVDSNIRDFRIKKIESIYSWFLKELEELEGQKDMVVNEQIKKMETAKIQTILEQIKNIN